MKSSKFVDHFTGFIIAVLIILSSIVSIQNTLLRSTIKQLAWSYETMELQYIQQRALYEECMELTFHVPAGKPVDRRLNK